MDSSSPCKRAAQLSWASCHAIATRHGASFYLADIGHFECNFRRFLDAFRAIYPNSRLGYSYKTNYLPHFLRLADNLGAYAEVVSRFELDLAERMGVDGRSIIFNGPIKSRDDLIHAIQIGAQVNVDSYTEFECILRVADASSTPVSVGIRCFLGENTPGSRFGIDLNDSKVSNFLDVLQRNPKLRVAGLHCHHSGVRSIERYRARIRGLISIHERQFGRVPLLYIDVGGGFAGYMSPSLAAQMSTPIPSFGEYADVIAGEMRAAYGDSGPELILEPGMALLADTMVFITQVKTLKQLDGRGLAVVDGSLLNIQPLRGSINLPVSVIRQAPERQSAAAAWDIVGNTCMEIDILHKHYDGDLSAGDFIVVENVGAYSTVLNAPFIRGTPPVLDFSDSEPGRILKRSSTVSDLLDMHERWQ